MIAARPAKRYFYLDKASGKVIETRQVAMLLRQGKWQCYLDKASGNVT